MSYLISKKAFQQPKTHTYNTKICWF
uniref:Uncharacterized protein n=1 Tax=Rhizophora mucronata TaxID=61149 RepID=A0A2P2PTW8_RHIMU